MIYTMREMYGLDKPLLERYAYWMLGLMTGDLGISLTTNQPVWNTIEPRIWPTVSLAAAVFLFQFLIAIPIGMYSALRQYSWGITLPLSLVLLAWQRRTLLSRLLLC